MNSSRREDLQDLASLIVDELYSIGDELSNTGISQQYAKEIVFDALQEAYRLGGLDKEREWLSTAKPVRRRRKRKAAEPRPPKLKSVAKSVTSLETRIANLDWDDTASAADPAPSRKRKPKGPAKKPKGRPSKTKPVNTIAVTLKALLDDVRERAQGVKSRRRPKGR